MKKYTKKGPYKKNCPQCSANFEGVHNKIYCSKQCAQKVYERNRYPDISTSSIGALNELRVCADLLAKGYETFRAVSPSCSCDLIILKNGSTKRIEVKTAFRLANGKVVFGKNNYYNEKNFEHLATVLKDEIIYLPPLEEK